MAHSLEPSIRALGVPTRLIRGKVVLDSPFAVCKEGDVLNSQQTRLLKMFGVATAEFKVNLIA
jgi:mRNA turnover protein 4